MEVTEGAIIKLLHECAINEKLLNFDDFWSKAQRYILKKKFPEKYIVKLKDFLYSSPHIYFLIEADAKSLGEEINRLIKICKLNLQESSELEKDIEKDAEKDIEKDAEKDIKKEKEKEPEKEETEKLESETVESTDDALIEKKKKIKEEQQKEQEQEKKGDKGKEQKIESSDGDFLFKLGQHKFKETPKEYLILTDLMSNLWLCDSKKLDELEKMGIYMTNDTLTSLIFNDHLDKLVEYKEKFRKNIKKIDESNKKKIVDPDPNFLLECKTQLCAFTLILVLTRVDSPCFERLIENNKKVVIELAKNIKYLFSKDYSPEITRIYEQLETITVQC